MVAEQDNRQPYQDARLCGVVGRTGRERKKLIAGEEEETRHRTEIRHRREQIRSEDRARSRNAAPVPDATRQPPRWR